MRGGEGRKRHLGQLGGGFRVVGVVNIGFEDVQLTQVRRGEVPLHLRRWRVIIK